MIFRYIYEPQANVALLFELGGNGLNSNQVRLLKGLVVSKLENIAGALLKGLLSHSCLL